MTILSSHVRNFVCSAAMGALVITSQSATADGNPECPASPYLAGGYAKEDLLNLIEAAALETDLVPANLATSLAEEVSGLQPELIGRDCRIGLFQLSGAEIQQRLGIDPGQLIDPNVNTRVGLVLLADFHRENGGDWMAAAQKLTGRKDLVLYASVSSPYRRMSASDTSSDRIGVDAQTTESSERIPASNQFPIVWFETPADRRAARLSSARLKFRTALAEKKQQDERAAKARPKQYHYD